MDTNTLITIGVSFATSAIVAFAVVAVRVGRYAEKIDQLEKCNLNTRLSTLEGRQLTRRTSPLNLTEWGVGVLNASGGKKFVDDNYAELKKSVEKKNPKTSYDIQEASRTVILELKEDERMNPVKEYLFKEGMEIDNVIEVVGIYLRNLILKEKGIDVSDIDKHGKS